MRVPTYAATTTVISQIADLSSRQNELQDQVSSGQRVKLPGDDPAAVGRLLTLEAEKRRVGQFERNSDIALELTQATYSHLSAMKDLNVRAGELALLGTGTLGAEAAKAYAAEVDQLIEQAVRTGNGRLRDDYLFAGTAVKTEPIAVTRDASGKITASTYAGNTDKRAIALTEQSTLDVGSTGPTNTAIADFINSLVTLRDALTNGDRTALDTSIAGLEASEDVIVEAIGTTGAAEMRIEVGRKQLGTRSDEIERLVSAEADADLPSTIVKLSQATTAYEAALASASRILNMSILDYLR
ncbi:flagellin [Actomonas aquatica]|uniref:Flagellin n=1 Tax=Actomonas aquatica TaxID=2866162 RepID=A0ABZ1CAI5_9BACT|nr:flagellin [Opitutus sp. WL0086]WRQ87609.1 flagellin [Opitutus sp. WL0086]